HLGERLLHLVEWNFASISCRHHSRAVTHLLAEYGRIHPGQFPPAITAVTKCMHPSLRKPKGSQYGMQECMQHTCFAQRSSTLRTECKRGLSLRTLQEALDRKSTRLNSSHDQISYAVFCLKKKKTIE